MVLAASDKDPEGPVEPKEVVEIYHNRPDPLIELTIGNQTIRCTLKHPFYEREKGWTAAAELEIGDELRTHEGDWVKLIGKEDKVEVEPVYNFHVAEHHTYFVASPDGRSSVLVHNESGGSLSYAGTRHVGGTTIHVFTFGGTPYGQLMGVLEFRSDDEKSREKALEIARTRSGSVHGRIVIKDGVAQGGAEDLEWDDLWKEQEEMRREWNRSHTVNAFVMICAPDIVLPPAIEAAGTTSFTAHTNVQRPREKS